MSLAIAVPNSVPPVSGPLPDWLRAYAPFQTPYVAPAPPADPARAASAYAAQEIIDVEATFIPNAANAIEESRQQVTLSNAAQPAIGYSRKKTGVRMLYATPATGQLINTSA